MALKVQEKDRRESQHYYIYTYTQFSYIVCAVVFIFCFSCLSLSSFLIIYFFPSLYSSLLSTFPFYQNCYPALYIFRFLSFLSPFIEFHDVRSYLGSSRYIHAEFLIRVTRFSPWILLEVAAHFVSPRTSQPLINVAPSSRRRWVLPQFLLLFFIY